MEQAKFLNLGFWNNTNEDSPERAKGIQKVVDAVEEFGVVRVSFEYTGRTAHEIASIALCNTMPDGYEFDIGYNYKCIVRKDAE